ncbi:hypothetical protein RYX36_016179 [Vicia faba]
MLGLLCIARLPSLSLLRVSSIVACFFLLHNLSHYNPPISSSPTSSSSNTVPQAEQIHVVTRSRDLDVWKNKLQENQTYMVYNCETMLYDMPVKVCDNKYKLFFNRSTTITVVDIPDIPQHKFNFKSFTHYRTNISLLIAFMVFIVLLNS